MNLKTLFEKLENVEETELGLLYDEDENAYIIVDVDNGFDGIMVLDVENLVAAPHPENWENLSKPLRTHLNNIGIKFINAPDHERTKGLVVEYEENECDCDEEDELGNIIKNIFQDLIGENDLTKQIKRIVSVKTEQELEEVKRNKKYFYRLALATDNTEDKYLSRRWSDGLIELADKDFKYGYKNIFTEQEFEKLVDEKHKAYDWDKEPFEK